MPCIINKVLEVDRRNQHLVSKDLGKGHALMACPWWLLEAAASLRSLEGYREMHC